MATTTTEDVGAVTAAPYPLDVGFTVHATAYGRPATELLGRQVDAAKGGDPLAPVTVVVASNYAAVAGRRALAARLGGVPWKQRRSSDWLW